MFVALDFGLQGHSGAKKIYWCWLIMPPRRVENSDLNAVKCASETEGRLFKRTTSTQVNHQTEQDSAFF